MKRKIIFCLAILGLFIVTGNLNADNMHQYFFDLSKQMNSAELKINFLEKAIETNPLFKEAYDALIKIYEEAGETIKVLELKNKLAKSLDAAPKLTEAADATQKTALPIIPVTITKPESQPELKSAETDEKKKIDKSIKNSTAIEPAKSDECTTAPAAITVEKAKTVYTSPIYKIEETDKSSSSSLKTTAYSFTAAAVSAAVGYYGYKYYEAKKREKQMQSIKNAIYYTVGVAAITTAGYYTYKYFTAQKRIAAPLIQPPSVEQEIERFLRENEYQQYEESQIQKLPPLPQPPPLPRQQPTATALNINSITYEQLRALPECDDFNADLIIKYRDFLYSQTGGGYESVAQLYQVPLIDPIVINSISKYFSN